MLDLRNKLKRQIEILGICISQNHPHPLKTFDLADRFGVDEITIKRDLTELRTSGINIHSEKRNGVCLYGTLDAHKIRELIHQYAAISNTNNFVEKATSLLVNRLNDKALANIVTLQMCIENHRAALIDYEKETDELEFRREIHPLLIFQSENYWRVLASNEGKIKQFHLNKIIEARATEKKFVPLEAELLEDIFRYSWRSWLGSDKYKVKMNFSKRWAERIRPKQLIENEMITENSDGSIVYEATVNSLDEIAGWIVSRGEGVAVLEPAELKEKVMHIARGALENYAEK